MNIYYSFANAENKMKTLTIAASLSILLISSAFAGDSTSTSARDGVSVFPPITQTLSYSYTKALAKPASSPAAGTLALMPPITTMMGETYSRPVHSTAAIH